MPFVQTAAVTPLLLGNHRQFTLEPQELSQAVHTVHWAELIPTDWQRGNSVYHAPKNLSFAQGSRAPRSGGVGQAIASSSYLPIVSGKRPLGLPTVNYFHLESSSRSSSLEIQN